MGRVFRNLKIGKKLFIGYAVTIILTGILVPCNLAITYKIKEAQTGAIEGNQITLQMGRENRNITMAAYVSYEADSIKYKPILKDFDDSIEKISQMGDSLIQLIKQDPYLDAAEREQALAFLQNILHMVTVEDVSSRNTLEAEIIEGDSNGDGIMSGLIDSINEANATAIIINDNLNIIIREMELNAQEITAQTSEDTYTGAFWLNIFAIGFIIMSTIVAIVVSSEIRKPIIRLSEAAEEIAKGNLDTLIRSNAKDEISNAFGEVVDVFSLLAGYINSSYLKLLDGELDVSIDERPFAGGL